jgi:hypothetical protein
MMSRTMSRLHTILTNEIASRVYPLFFSAHKTRGLQTGTRLVTFVFRLSLLTQANLFHLPQGKLSEPVSSVLLSCCSMGIC